MRMHEGPVFRDWWQTPVMTSSNGNIFRVTDLCAGNSPVPVNSPHKGQWRGALMFSLICVCINGWINNREAGDLRRCRGHYDVNVMRHKQCNMSSTQSIFVITLTTYRSIWYRNVYILIFKRPMKLHAFWWSGLCLDKAEMWLYFHINTFFFTFDRTVWPHHQRSLADCIFYGTHVYDVDDVYQTAYFHSNL